MVTVDGTMAAWHRLSRTPAMRPRRHPSVPNLKFAEVANPRFQAAIPFVFSVPTDQKPADKG